MSWVWNHLEIKKTCELLNERLKGSKLMGWIVPERNESPKGYFRSEWGLRFSDRNRQTATLILSLRNSALGAYLEEHSVRSSETAPRSGFFQKSKKLLENASWVQMIAPPGERICWIEWKDPNSARLKLILEWIPARPTAYITDDQNKILACSRPTALTSYLLPKSREAPNHTVLRPEFLELRSIREKFLQQYTDEVQQLRRLELDKKIQDKEKRFKQVAKTVSSEEAELSQPINQPDRLEKIAQALLNLPETKSLSWTVELWEPEESLVVENSDQNTNFEISKKYFAKSKRYRRKLIELKSKQEDFKKLSDELEKLKKLATQSELPAAHSTIPATKPSGGGGKTWQGPSFYSKEGYSIWVGRNVAENLQLTFRAAQGNDLWFHPKGVVGAHVILKLPKGKSASLDSLLDAAQVCLIHSKLQDKGKIEIDYTYCKFLKKIPGSSLVRFSQNKTLMINHDPDRYDEIFKRSKNIE